MARSSASWWGSSLALLRSTRPALLPTAGKFRPFGDIGGSHLPSVVIVPVKGVAVGRGVRVVVGRRGVLVAVICVATIAVLVSAMPMTGGTGVDVCVTVGEGVDEGEGVAVCVRVGVMVGVKVG